MLIIQDEQVYYAFFLRYSGRSLYCVHIDEYEFNVFFLHYSGGSKFNVFVPRGTKFYIGFSFASESQHLLPALQWVEGLSPEDSVFSKGKKLLP